MEDQYQRNVWKAPQPRWVTAAEGWEFTRKAHPVLALPPGRQGLYNYFRNKARVCELHAAGVLLRADRGHYLVQPQLFADWVFAQSTRRSPVEADRRLAPSGAQAMGAITTMHDCPQPVVSVGKSPSGLQFHNSNCVGLTQLGKPSPRLVDGPVQSTTLDEGATRV